MDRESIESVFKDIERTFEKGLESSDAIDVFAASEMGDVDVTINVFINELTIVPPDEGTDV